MSFVHEHARHPSASQLYEAYSHHHHHQQPPPSALEEYCQPPMSGQPQALSTPTTTPELSYMQSTHPHPHTMPILQPAPTRRIDARYLETASDSPEMHVLHTPQQQFHHMPLTWVKAPEYEYEYVSYDTIQPSHAPYIEYVQVAPPVQYAYYGLAPRSQAPYDGGYVSQHSYSHQGHVPCEPQYYLHHASASTYSAPTVPQPALPSSSYAPFTPAPSNHGSGASTPHEDYSIGSEYRHDGTEVLNTPVTPSTRPKVPWLLLGQSVLPQTSIQPAQTLHQHPDATSAHHSPVEMHSPARSYYAHAGYDTPISPVSPVIHGLAHPPTAFHGVKEESGVAPSVLEGSPAVQETNPIVSVETAATMSQAEERLKKLRDRRHVIACTFCRGRKIACHSTPKSDEADSTGASKNEDEYRPVIRGTKRANAAANKPPCDNCIRRGRECVYPPRAARASRRRRREARDQSPFSPEYED